MKSTQFLTQVKSDPIFDSSGEGHKYDLPMSAEMEEEFYLRSLKPKTFELEEGEHPETMDSLKWAEEALNKTLVIPHIDPVPI